MSVLPFKFTVGSQTVESGPDVLLFKLKKGSVHSIIIEAPETTLQHDYQFVLMRMNNYKDPVTPFNSIFKNSLKIEFRDQPLDLEIQIGKFTPQWAKIDYFTDSYVSCTRYNNQEIVNIPIVVQTFNLKFEYVKEMLNETTRSEVVNFIQELKKEEKIKLEEHRGIINRYLNITYRPNEREYDWISIDEANARIVEVTSKCDANLKKIDLLEKTLVLLNQLE